MSRRNLLRAPLLAGVLSVLALAAGDAQAQRGRLIGTVNDTAGKPVAGAVVAVAALRLETATDEQGVFVFSDLPSGAIDLSIRRIGYEPLRVPVAITGAYDSLIVRLVQHALALEGIAVTASTQRQRMNIEAFYERVRRGTGTYVTRSDILARRPLSATDMFRTVPGIRVFKGRGIDGIRFNTSSSMRRDCAPMVWIDGQRAPGMELGEVPVSDVEGIELYNGPSTTPLQFSQGPTGYSCGVIVVWTRPPPPASIRP